MCDIDFLGPEFFSSTYRKARKLQKCVECCGPIPPGSRHRRVAGKWDGSFDTFAIHVECEQLRDFCETVVCGDEGVVPFGGLAQELHDAATQYGLWLDGDDAVSALSPLLDYIRDEYTKLAEAAT